MASDEFRNPRSNRLRERAERHVQRLPREAGSLQDRLVDDLTYELEIHGTELEMQNDELRANEAQLLTAKTKYFELFEWAPVGFVNLDRFGAIVEINLAGAALTGVERRRLVGRRFTSMVTAAYRNEFETFFRHLAAGGGRAEIELKVAGADQPAAHVLVTAVAGRDGAAGSEYVQLALTDITAR